MNEDFLQKGIAEIIDKKSLEHKLKSKKKLRIKMGFDPTRPDIHLGHAVGLRILKKLQDAGHTIIFLIGDYTTKIGDPSGRNTTRPILDDAEIKKNAATYFEQVGKILDVKKAQVRYNSEWYEKMNFNDILKIAGKFTVAQITERDDFEKRLKKGIDVGLHEMLYPLMQAYDSVVLEADIEFGGTDQKFNMLAGRDLQRKMNQTPQDVVMVGLLVGLDGKEKMSKSLDNYIGITEDPKTMFGKIMSIPDSLIFSYFNLCTDLSDADISKLEKKVKNGLNPRDAKMILAEEIVKIYHNKNEASKAKAEFERVFSKRELPADIPEVKISGSFDVPSLVISLIPEMSRSEARRLITQGAVKIDGAKIIDEKTTVSVVKGTIIQIGKLKVFKAE